MTLLLVAAFGVLHGMGFGGAFVAMFGGSDGAGQLPQMLAAFALGVEAAQLLMLGGLWLVFYTVFEMLQWRPLLLRKLLLGFVIVLALGVLISAL